MGKIFFDDDATLDDIFIVPETATVGEYFQVTVFTDVGACTVGGQTTRVSVERLRAEVLPIDNDMGRDVCVAEPPTPYMHEATVRFYLPGDAEVVLRAWSFRTRSVVELPRSIRVDCPFGQVPSGSVYSPADLGPDRARWSAGSRTPPIPPPCAPAP